MTGAGRQTLVRLLDKRAGLIRSARPGPWAGHTQALLRRPASSTACPRSLVSKAPYPNQGLMQHYGYVLFLGIA